MAGQRSYPATPLGTARAHRDKQHRRLADFGHRMVWSRHGEGRYAGYLGACRRCLGEAECTQYGTRWRLVIGAPSLLQYMGVNIIARCPGGR